MAPRDGDENRKPRHLAAQPIAPAADESDGEDNDIVDDDIVDNDIVDNDDDNDDDNEDDSEEDSDEMESANEEEDPVQREIRKQRVRTETAEFKAERIEASATREEQRQLTQRIREDVQRIEAQRIALIAQRERDLAELARIEAAAAQGVDPPPLTPTPEEQSIQINGHKDGAGPYATGNKLENGRY